MIRAVTPQPAGAVDEDRPGAEPAEAAAVAASAAAPAAEAAGKAAGRAPAAGKTAAAEAAASAAARSAHVRAPVCSFLYFFELIAQLIDHIAPRDNAAEHPAPVGHRHKVLHCHQVYHILHAHVNIDRAVPHAPLHLTDRHPVQLLRAVVQEQPQKVAFGDRADIFPLGADHRDRGKAAFQHIVQRLPHRAVVQ